MMSEKLFNRLRTKQQLCYSVTCNSEQSVGGIVAFTISVVADSSKFSPDTIDEKIEEFLRAFYKELEEEEQFVDYVRSYVKSIKQADLALCDEGSRYWSEIYHQDYIFDRRERTIAVANKIEKSELLSMMREHLIDSETVRMLSVQVIGYFSEIDLAHKIIGERNSSAKTRNEHNTSEENQWNRFTFTPLTSCSPQYTRSVTDIEQFKSNQSFYRITKMSLDD